jgi:protein AroM
MATRVGLITIGQSPRPDVVPEVLRLVGRPLEAVEMGALDGLDPGAVRALAPGAGDETLVTRMRDGAEVHIAKRHMVPRIQACIDRLAPSVDILVLLCTGRFPEFHSPRPFLEPQAMVDRIVESLAGPGGAVGVLVPGAAQVEASRAKTSEYGLVPTVVAASPYTKPEQVGRAAAVFRGSDVKLVVMHCIGYDAAMREAVRTETGKPVLLARSLVGKILDEML